VVQNLSPESGFVEHYQIMSHVEPARLQVFENNCNKLIINAFYTNIINSKTHKQLQNRFLEHLLFPLLMVFWFLEPRILITHTPRITNLPQFQPLKLESNRVGHRDIHSLNPGTDLAEKRRIEYLDILT
jgi:hypothetical protein